MSMHLPTTERREDGARTGISPHRTLRVALPVLLAFLLCLSVGCSQDKTSALGKTVWPLRSGQTTLVAVSYTDGDGENGLAQIPADLEESSFTAPAAASATGYYQMADGSVAALSRDAFPAPGLLELSPDQLCQPLMGRYPGLQISASGVGDTYYTLTLTDGTQVYDLRFYSGIEEINQHQIVFFSTGSLPEGHSLASLAELLDQFDLPSFFSTDIPSP